MNSSVDFNCLEERVAHLLNLLVTTGLERLLPVGRQQLEQRLAKITYIVFGTLMFFTYMLRL